MKFDMNKYADFLAKNAREGVIIENKILEWKLAESGLKSVEEFQALQSAKRAKRLAKEPLLKARQSWHG